jgi:hypothetical protein
LASPSLGQAAPLAAVPWLHEQTAGIVTTVNRSQLHPEGKSSAPFFPLPSMSALFLILMKRLWAELCIAICPLPASTTVNRSQVHPEGNVLAVLVPLVSILAPFILIKRLWIEL